MLFHNQIIVKIIRRMLAYACNDGDNNYLEEFWANIWVETSGDVKECDNVPQISGSGFNYKGFIGLVWVKTQVKSCNRKIAKGI